MDKFNFNRPYSHTKVKSPCPQHCASRSWDCKHTCPEWAAYEKAKKEEETQKKILRSGAVVSANTEKIIRKHLRSYKYSH